MRCFFASLLRKWWKSFLSLINLGSCLLLRDYSRRSVEYPLTCTCSEFISCTRPPEVFRKKGVLKNFANFTGKHLCWRLFNIVAGLQPWRPATLLKRLRHECFPVKFAKFWRTSILKNIYDRLLLCIKWLHVSVCSWSFQYQFWRNHFLCVSF